MKDTTNYCPDCKRVIEEDEIDYLDIVPEQGFPTEMAHPRECNDPVCPECGHDLVDAYQCIKCEEWFVNPHMVGKEWVCDDCLPLILVRNYDRELVEELSISLSHILNKDAIDCVDAIENALKEYYKGDSNG